MQLEFREHKHPTTLNTSIIRSRESVETGKGNVVSAEDVFPKTDAVLRSGPLNVGLQTSYSTVNKELSRSASSCKSADVGRASGSVACLGSAAQFAPTFASKTLNRNHEKPGTLM